MEWSTGPVPTIVVYGFLFCTAVLGQINEPLSADKQKPMELLSAETGVDKRTLFNNIPLNITYRAQRNPTAPGARRKSAGASGAVYGLGRQHDGLHYILYEKPWWMTSYNYPTLVPATEQRLGLDKRNFDMLDTPGFERFEKRNLDMIDSPGFGHFVKRSVKNPGKGGQKRNFDQIDSPTGFMEYFHFYP
ncbi:uncharacterized protein LOC129602185 [Paramacrobiotus metropolitanus]|uniref:uncharacterized protein LOC129602185 n=1 Tax=Paramacrobiotus metropolitanus TaxID=2943436 RepID=UPI002445E8D8|nr:uncharacterized protein LOC129602185 [Paramacrobiotus metropolitanus]